MTSHLLLLTIGPVQDFIAQARRTRDLWYGSHLLSELGRAGARALVEGGAQLVFPYIAKGDPELAPCSSPQRADGTTPHSVANKLLAEVPVGIDPEQLAKAVRQAILVHWRDHIAEPVKRKCAELLADGVDEVWTDQIDTFLEIQLSWLPLDDYGETRRQLEREIAGRKLLRDFDPWMRGRGNVPKSSLDGARETVLRPGAKRTSNLFRKYRIASGEELDAIGLVKRAGGEPDQFVPIVNVALTSWLLSAKEHAREELDELARACRGKLSEVRRHDLPCGAAFPFDGSILLRSRWQPVFQERGLAEDPASWGRRHVAPLYHKLGEPHPYVACLVADGDRVGRAIDALPSPDAHRAFSRALAAFAAAARELVEQNHRGLLIYAGGDDVLAFLPLPEALSCAEALRRSFEEKMASALDSLPREHRPTLSIGLGIGHVMEAMGDLLALGRRAEHEAKRDRNSLAIVVEKRSGGVHSWRARWTDAPVERMRRSVALLRSVVPSRKVYEVAAALRAFPSVEPTADAAWARALAGEIERIIARSEGAGLRLDDVGMSIDPASSYSSVHSAVNEWVARMLIARTFARAAVRGPEHEEATA